jgi:hypothetical protein
MIDPGMEGKLGNLFGWAVKVFQVGGVEYIGSAAQIIQTAVQLEDFKLALGSILVVLRP